MKIHERIRTLRKEKHWTQEDMAGKLGMSVVGYAKIERGETDYQLGLENYLAKLIKIATVLDANLEDLLEETAKHVYLVGLITGDNNCFNSPVVGSPTELNFEMQKLQLIIKNKDAALEHKNEMLEQKDKEIAMQQREIEQLNKMISLLEKTNLE